MKFAIILNRSNPSIGPIKARFCNSFFCRLRGLMFTPSIDQHEGLLMVQERADRLNSAIHMLFMRYDLAAIWLDNQYRVVDVKLCRRWRLMYAPRAAACYVLETHRDRYGDFHIGDQAKVQL